MNDKMLEKMLLDQPVLIAKLKSYVAKLESEARIYSVISSSPSSSPHQLSDVSGSRSLLLQTPNSTGKKDTWISGMSAGSSEWAIVQPECQCFPYATKLSLVPLGRSGFRWDKLGLGFRSWEPSP